MLLLNHICLEEIFDHILKIDQDFDIFDKEPISLEIYFFFFHIKFALTLPKLKILTTSICKHSLFDIIKSFGNKNWCSLGCREGNF